MLSKEEKLILHELPQVNEELDKTIQFLEQLSNSKGTISEDRYKQLENKYSTSISELKVKKELITNQFEMKKDELSIEKATLQNRRKEVANNLQEINHLKDQNAISKEEYKKESKQQNEYFGLREHSVRSNRATSPQKLSHPLGGESHFFNLCSILLTQVSQMHKPVV